MTLEIIVNYKLLKKQRESIENIIYSNNTLPHSYSKETISHLIGVLELLEAISDQKPFRQGE